MHSRHGFNWFDRRGTEGVGFIRALRTLLTSNLPKILPDLTCIIRTRFQELHATHPVIDGTMTVGEHLLQLTTMNRKEAVGCIPHDCETSRAFKRRLFFWERSRYVSNTSRIRFPGLALKECSKRRAVHDLSARIHRGDANMRGDHPPATKVLDTVSPS
jgi:hypothetical protein